MTPRQHRRWVKEAQGLIRELRDMQPHLDDLQTQITALRARADTNAPGGGEWR